jgi:hypothetical protein
MNGSDGRTASGGKSGGGDKDKQIQGTGAENGATDETRGSREEGAASAGGSEGRGPAGGARDGGPDAGPMDADGRFAEEGETDDLKAPQRERARRAVDELERRLRGGDIDEKALRDLGWTRAQARRFVEEFRRRDAEAQRQGRGGLFTGRPREDADKGGDRRADRAKGGAGAGGAGVRTERRDQTSEDTLREAPPERVAPEYRDLLREYYRSMGREKDGREKTKD